MKAQIVKLDILPKKKRLKKGRKNMEMKKKERNFTYLSRHTKFWLMCLEKLTQST